MAPIGNKHAVGNKGNRGNPNVVKYKPEYCQQMVDFFRNAKLQEIQTESIAEEFYKDGTTKKRAERKKFFTSRLPSFLRFAEEIHVYTSTLDDWRVTYTDFDRSYRLCKELQKQWLIDAGLSGTVPPAAFVFVAKNVTDMRDRTETDITSGGGKLGIVMLPEKILNE